MSHKAAKIGLTSLVLVLAFGGLLYSTLSEGTEYYKHVDEVMASPQQWEGKNLQVHGFAKDVRRARNSLEYHFNVENNGKVIKAIYTGIAPDTFKDDSEVVVRGKLSSDGTFHVVPDGVFGVQPNVSTVVSFRRVPSTFEVTFGVSLICKTSPQPRPVTRNVSAELLGVVLSKRTEAKTCALM